MIASIHGPVIALGDGNLIIEAGGLGYKVRVPDVVIRNMEKNEVIFLYTELIIRPDVLVLYGFLSYEEADIFRMLISVSHIGPQTGLSVINKLSINEIYEAITKEKPDILSRVPGLGKKGAERIILELKNKLSPIENMESSEELNSSPVQDATLALLSLGYHQDEAERACNKVYKGNPACSSSDLIRESLKILKKK